MKTEEYIRKRGPVITIGKEVKSRDLENETFGCFKKIYIYYFRAIQNMLMREGGLALNNC